MIIESRYPHCGILAHEEGETGLRLLVHVEGEPERTIEVGAGPAVAGRVPECDIPLPYSGVSRRHARITKGPGGTWILEDLGGRNGTLLNGRLITAAEPLSAGDRIGMGSVLLTVTPDDLVRAGDTAAGAMTVVRNVADLRRKWVGADTSGFESRPPDTRVDRMADLLEIAKDLNLAISIDSIFHQAREVVFRYLRRIERLALLVDVAGDGRLELLHAAGRGAKPGDLAWDHAEWVSRSICQMAFSDRVAVQTADARLDSRFDGVMSIVSKDIRTAIAVPLWNEDLVVGVLYADAHLPSGHWEREGEEDLAFFSALANLVATSVQRWRYVARLRSEEQMRQRLERYHSPSVVQHLVAENAAGSGRLQPKDCNLTVLFADIVSFTDLSERLTPTEVAQLLNVFFEEMLQEIFSRGGTLDKFIGDCIMAFFGAPEEQPDHAQRAVAAARGMLRRLEGLNRRQVFVRPLQMRIAVNSGRAVVGDVGSPQRLEYTVLGSTINLASRMEKVCNPGECVISELTYAALEDRRGWRDLGPQEFRGVHQAVRVYRGGPDAPEG